SPRQHKAVLRVLERSPEAREALRQMQQDSALLRTLPQKSLPPSFADRVLQIIAQRKVLPFRRVRPAVAAGIPAWGGGAVAAAVLVAVSVGSYWYFRGGDKDGTGNDGTTVAGKNNKPAGPAVKPAYQHNQPKKGGGSETPVENKIPDHKFEPGPIVMVPENPPVKVPQPQQAPGTKTPPGDTVLAGLGKPADDGEPEA